MGVFNIHSSGELASITCSMFENTAISYQVLPTSVDPGYDKRVEVIYAETATGGSPAGLKTGLVGFKFTMFISGADQATVMSNIATVTKLLTSPDGGFIEYRPIGLAAGVMTTWYRFVQSGVPKMARREGLINTVMEKYLIKDPEFEQVDGALMECEVETFAWGTSDPYDLVAIMSEQTVENCYDSTHDNTFTVASTSVKGDAIVPIFTIKGGNVGGVNDIGSIVLHKRQMAAGASADHLDWREAEDFLTGTGWANASDAANSNGEYAHRTGDDTTGEAFDWASDTPERDMIGKVAPIVVMRCAAADDSFTIRLKSTLVSSDDAARQYTDEVYFADYVTNWQAITFTTLDLPASVIPEWVGEGTNIALDDFFGGQVEISVVADDQGDSIRVDFAWFPKVDGGNYLAEIKHPRLAATLDDAQTRYLMVDCTVGAAYLSTTATDKVYDMFIASGPPLTDLMIFDGYNSQFRILGAYNSGLRVWERDWDFRVSIEGLYATIYPFSET